MESEKILPFNLALQKKLHLHVPSNKSEQRPSILDLPELIYLVMWFQPLVGCRW